jgi:hypothetical protein
MKAESNLNWPTLGELKDSQPLWYYAAGFNFAVLAFCLVAGIFDERTLNGVSVWSKPVKFGLSIGLYFITLVWFATFLSRETLTGTAGKTLVAIPLISGVTEMVYIAIMASLGQASHFNFSSGFTSIMYSLMGVGAAAMVLVLPWLGYLIARQNPMTNPLILAIVAGLCVTCVLGGGFGSHLGGQDGHWVNASRTDAGGVWLFNWATDGGDLRVAHFFGMHAMHAFPIFALLLPKNWGQPTKLLLLSGFMAVYTAFSVATFIQALNGQAFLPG